MRPENRATTYTLRLTLHCGLNVSKSFLSKPREMTLSISPEIVWLNPPPLTTTPLFTAMLLTFGGSSIQPSLMPGPKILEKLPLDITLPL